MAKCKGCGLLMTDWAGQTEVRCYHCQSLFDRAEVERLKGALTAVQLRCAKRHNFDPYVLGSEVLTLISAALAERPGAGTGEAGCLLPNFNEEDAPRCVTHDKLCDWVECTGWRCPVSGKIVTEEAKPATSERPGAGTGRRCTCDSGLGDDPHKSHCQMAPPAEAERALKGE